MAQVPHTSTEHAAHARHTSPVLVFVILTLFTLIEVGITLLGLPKASIVPVLLAIALVKASLVAMYYMHLRYEKIIFTLIFVLPTLFAVFLVTVLMIG
ncbi:MAG: cytochrome C oxidase subunit IV family protein [Chloroflexi bacterium]|nr:cytochrome C oxidase subunit IV family protein [Chloroflexota bacterium]